MTQIDGTSFAAKFMSEPVAALVPETLAQAASYVKSHATDATDAQTLLEMLGLLDD